MRPNLTRRLLALMPARHDRRDQRRAGRARTVNSIHRDLRIHTYARSVERELPADAHREVRVRQIGSRREGAGKERTVRWCLRSLRNREVHLIRTLVLLQRLGDEMTGSVLENRPDIRQLFLKRGSFRRRRAESAENEFQVMPSPALEQVPPIERCGWLNSVSRQFITGNCFRATQVMMVPGSVTMI